MTNRRSSGMPRRYLVVGVLAVLAVVIGFLGPLAFSTLGNGSAKDRIAADPPPPLFPAVAVSPLEQQVAAEQGRATALMHQWWAAHGSGRHDDAYVRWLEMHVPGPPTPTQRSVEVAQVQALAGTRTPAGVKASTWLETYGKKDIWKLYAHDQAELLPKMSGDRVKQAVKDMLAMSKAVADTLGARYQESAPYVLHPSLRPDHVVTTGQVCPCSYPSRHAAAGAAAVTYLSGREPQRATEYRWTQAQIDYSRVYMAGHVTSDVTAGALLGDMIGAYFLHAERV